MLNINGLNKRQQTQKDKRLKDAGSLWGSFPIYYHFAFTKQELNRVQEAKKTLEKHDKKINGLFGCVIK